MRAAGWLDHAEIGYNYRLSELACALGRVQLERLGEMLTARAEAAARYNRLLSGVPGLELPALALPRRTLSWFVYAVRLPLGANRDRVQAALAARGIATGRYFPPIHRQPAWRGRASTAVDLPVTEATAGRMLALPFFTRITVEAQKRFLTPCAPRWRHISEFLFAPTQLPGIEAMRFLRSKIHLARRSISITQDFLLIHATSTPLLSL